MPWVLACLPVGRKNGEWKKINSFPFSIFTHNFYIFGLVIPNAAKRSEESLSKPTINLIEQNTITLSISKFWITITNFRKAFKNYCNDICNATKGITKNGYALCNKTNTFTKFCNALCKIQNPISDLQHANNTPIIKISKKRLWHAFWLKDDSFFLYFKKAKINVLN